MSSWPRLLQGLSLALVVFLAVFYLGSAASLPPTDTQPTDLDSQILPDTADASQPDRPVPTRRPGIQLVLSDIECEDGDVQVNFLVLRLPELSAPSAYGHVEYTVNGENKTAAFVRRVGPVGRYTGVLADAGSGRYDVTAASITIEGVTAELVNPHAETARCRPPHDGTPRPTETREPTRTPRPTGSPEPSRTPRPTESREPSRTPRPTESREPTRTPRPTEGPRPTRTPEPTRTARPLELRVDGIQCEEGRLQVHFVAGRVPEGTTAESLAGTTVHYSLQLLTLNLPPAATAEAPFRRLDSGVAHYMGAYPASGAPQDGVYLVTQASLTLGANTLTLPFPSLPAVIRGCGTRPSPEPTGRHEPTRTPTVTPTATLKP